MRRVETHSIDDIALGVFDGPHATPPPSEEGPIFLGIKNVTPAGRLDLSEIRHVAEQHFPKWTRRVTPQANDIVFSYEATLHRYAMIPDGFRGCLGRRMALVRPNPEKVVPRFLHYYFMTPSWRATVDATVINGATVDRIPLTRFPSLVVHLPPLPEQEAIAEALSAYDDLIDNNRRRIQLLEESARLLFREWFVHLRFPSHEHVRVVDGVPEGWTKTSLGRFVGSGAIQLQTGPFGTQLKASDYTSMGAPVINVRNIGYGNLRPEKLEFVPDTVVQRLAKHILQEGDIVFGRKGAVDRHLLASRSEAGWMQGSDCIRLRVVGGPFSPLFLSFHLRMESHKRWMLTQCSNKATMASLNQDVIGRIEILIPPAPLLREFDDFAGSVGTQVTALTHQATAAAQARDLLLPRLMSGELAA